MKLRINVTKHDIEVANRGAVAAAVECPVARAVRRQIPGARVGSSVFFTPRRKVGLAQIGLAGPYRSFPLPTAVREFIAVFDGVAEGTLRPFSFELEVPESVRR